jgi:hypothetical protein
MVKLLFFIALLVSSVQPRLLQTLDELLDMETSDWIEAKIDYLSYIKIGSWLFLSIELPLVCLFIITAIIH